MVGGRRGISCTSPWKGFNCTVWHLMSGLNHISIVRAKKVSVQLAYYNHKTLQLQFL